MANLIIKVDQIEEPRQLDRRPLTRAFLEEILKDAPSYKLREPADFVAHLTRVGERNVLLEGATTLALQSDCRRCLRAVESEFPVVFMLSLVAKSAEHPAPRSGHERRSDKKEKEEEVEEEFDETQADEELYDGEKIDLAPILREQLLLGLPAIEPLCQEGCKGLCVVCGQDLNERDCGHQQKPPDPRWSALKGLKV